MNRTTCVLAGAAVLAAVAATAAAAMTSGGRQQALAGQQPHVSTATVHKGMLSATVAVDGTLTYATQADGSSSAVINEAHGSYTKLPTVGQVIRQGQVVYRVNDRPVVLLYGTTPAYRTLSIGASGPDVAELNADLIALGYATRAELRRTPSSLGSDTTAALEKLQAAVGLAPTGTLTLGQALFEPAAVRVTALAGLLGGRAQPGQTVFDGSSTTRVVQVALDAAQQTDVAVGDTVSITLPDNTITSGVVSTVGTVATCASSSGPGGSSSSTATLGTDSCSSGGSASGTPTVNVYVTPSDPVATGTWDQAPVQVGITTAEVRGALTVPVNALVARSSGGYAVEVAGAAGANQLVPVSLGLFDDADGLVQVSGSALAAGEKVVIPST